jgi:hypothetical protein
MMLELEARQAELKQRIRTQRRRRLSKNDMSKNDIKIKIGGNQILLETILICQRVSPF